MRARRQTVAAFGLAIVLLALFAAGAALRPDALITSLPENGGLPTLPPQTQAIEAPEPPTDVGSSSDAQAGSVFAAGLGIVLVVVAVLLVVVFAARLAQGFARRRSAPAEVEEIVTVPVVSAQAVAEIVRQARSRIDVEGEANRVVVRCWEALEHLASDAGVPRRASETAGEYVLDVLARLSLPPAPARRLAGLYEAALFSDGRLPQAAVAEAVDALEELDTALQTPQARS